MIPCELKPIFIYIVAAYCYYITSSSPVRQARRTFTNIFHSVRYVTHRYFPWMRARHSAHAQELPTQICSDDMKSGEMWNASEIQRRTKKKKRSREGHGCNECEWCQTKASNQKCKQYQWNNFSLGNSVSTMHTQWTALQKLTLFYHSTSSIDPLQIGSPYEADQKNIKYTPTIISNEQFTFNWKLGLTRRNFHRFRNYYQLFQ